MSNEHWTDKRHETITDTCLCGAKFSVSAQYPDSHFKRWLEAHEVCRSQQPAQPTPDYPYYETINKGA